MGEFGHQPEISRGLVVFQSDLFVMLFLFDFVWSSCSYVHEQYLI